MSEVSEAPAAPVDAPVEATDATGEEQTAAPAVEAPKAPPSTIKKFNITSNGKSRDVELDMSDEKAIKNYIEKAEGANARFEEAASIRKQAEALVKMLKENPKMLLKHPELGLDYKTLAAELMNEEIEEMAKSPEQKKIEEMERQLKKFEEEKKGLEERRREAELQAAQAEAFQQLDTDIDAALASTDLPKSAYVVKRLADTLLEAYELKDPKTGARLYPNVRVQDILPYVEEQITNEIQEMIGAKPNVLIEKLVGKKNLDNYRKQRVPAKPKVETAPQIKDTGTKTEAPKKDEKSNNKKFSQIFGGF